VLRIPLTRQKYDRCKRRGALKKINSAFLWIAYAMARVGEDHDEMWDERDRFFYDLLRVPDRQPIR
jgi:hypothetical protein